MTATLPSGHEAAVPERLEIPAAGHVLDYARRLGWRRALARGAYVAANQVVTLSIFDCFSLRREDINPALTRADKYECRFLAPHESHRFCDQLDAAMARILPSAMARGDDAYVILDGGRLASIGLYAADPTPVSGNLVVDFDPPVRYMYRGFTQIAYRGQRLHAVGILRAAGELFDRGVPQLVTVCERTNYPALVSVLRMGWQPRGAVYRVGAGRCLRLGRTTAARSIGVRLAWRQP